MPTQVLNVPPDNPLNGLPEALKERIVAAQTDALEDEFENAHELAGRAFADLKIAIKPPASLKRVAAADLGDWPAKELVAQYTAVLQRKNVPEQAISLHAANLTHRTQLLRAFRDPDKVVEETRAKVADVVGRFPQTAEDIQRGQNPGDVLDPYILGAAQVLMCAGDFEHTVSATVAHKVLMMIEGLLGHLHQDILGAMRGNLRAPEPRGRDKETLNPVTNPFPGADIVQPPLADGRPLRFHQVKSKTGSAKGGDGRRLGLQLAKLTNLYGGEAFYDALIGNTLRGHRSMAGVLGAAPRVVVLVGESAFRELTGSAAGPQLLLRLYQSAFDVAFRQTGYSLQTVVSAIFLAFRQRAEELGEGFLEAVLHDAIAGTPVQQDSRQFPRGRGRRSI
jgi:hypothetical protein